MADVKTISECLQAYAEHPLPKKFRFGLGIMFWQDTEQELYGSSCGDERDYALLISLKDKRNA
jgi:hypothetical protein